MALISYYATGTATVAANGTAVTGQGTQWVGSVKPGDLFAAAGLSERILSVNSSTSLTLARGWPGAARTAAVYEVRVTPAPSEIVGTVRQLLTSLSSGVLSAFAGLTSAANKLPFFTGAGTMATTDLTPKGREIIGAADNTAAQTAIGGSAVGRALFSATDAAAARLGLELSPGLQNPSTYAGGQVTDLNQYFPVGSYSVGSNATGAPTTSAGTLIVHPRWTNQQTQQFYELVSPYRSFARQVVGSSFLAWQEIYSGSAASVRSQLGLNEAANAFRRSNILGTVSQSSGVPTGAIIERGSNANGEYVRFADGTQICWYRAPFARSLNQATGALFFSSTPVGGSPHPAAFVGTPVQTYASEDNGAMVFSNAAAAGQFPSFYLFDRVSVTGRTYTVTFMAIGRWF